MTLSQWLILLYWWVKEYPVLKAAEEADVSDVSAIDVYQWLREVCMFHSSYTAAYYTWWTRESSSDR